jgi:hypothetical protein
MGKYRGGPKPWEKDDPKGRRLDPGQYPELNAVFYTADPAEFIKMRIESLSLMACSDEQLGPLYATAPLEPRSSARCRRRVLRPGSGISAWRR